MTTDLFCPGASFPASLSHGLNDFLLNSQIAVVMTLEGRMVSSTNRYHMLFGAAGLDDVTHPDDLQVDAEKKRQQLTGIIQSYRTEKRLFDTTKQERWFDLEVTLLQQRDSTAVLVVVLDDITEQRRMLQALLWNATRWRELLNNSPFLLFQCDSAGRLLYLTPSVAQVLSLDVDKWMGQSLRDLIHPDDRAQFASFFQDIFQKNTGSAVCRFCSPEGWAVLKLTARTDKLEPSVIVYAEDISTSVAMADQLQFYRQQYRDLLKDLSDMICP